MGDGNPSIEGNSCGPPATWEPKRMSQTELYVWWNSKPTMAFLRCNWHAFYSVRFSGFLRWLDTPSIFVSP